jgi:exodeoxyribonuclease VII large subunit
MELFEDTRGQNAPEFSVSEISGAVKKVIEGEFGRVRVRGEVGRVTRHASGHVYFDLKDERACLGAVAFRNAARGLRVQPQEGMEVIATGRMTTYPASSKYQLIVDEVAPAGVGALMAMLEERKAALTREGLFDPARKRPLPYLPEVIGVVTSPSGAVIRDILHRLRERFPRPVLLWPVTVQGERCAPEVAAAIRGFNAIARGGPVPRPDVIIVARGGGSIEDLWGFNEEIVVRAAAESRIPLISAVGHETDTTLIDFAADRRAPTPTAAAEIAVPVRLDLLAGVGRLEERRRSAVARAVAQRGQRLRDLSRGLPRPEALTAERSQRLDGLALRLPRALTALAQDRRLRLSRGAAGRFGPGLLAVGNERRRAKLLRAEAGLRPEAMHIAVERRRERLHARSERLEQVERRLTRFARTALEDGPAGRFGPAALRQRFDRLRERLDGRAERLERVERRLTSGQRDRLEALGRTLATLGPQAVLARGYAIVRDAGGAVLTRATAARAATLREIEFADGRLRAGPERRAARRSDPDPEPDQGSLL